MLTTPENLAVFRILITEVSRFPDLGRTFYHNGAELAYQKMSEYLQQQTMAGKLQITEPDLAARQLFEMMKGDLHLRALLCPDELPTKEQIEAHVRSAVSTFLKGTYPSG